MPTIDPSKIIQILQDLTLEELKETKGIGEKVGESIYQWFRDKKNLKLLYDLEKTGIKIEIEKPKSQKLLDNKTFVLTGILESMNREEAKRKIRDLGGNVSSSVSKKIDFVVVGKDPGSKYDKAKKLGVKIIKEEEFLELLRE